MSKPEDFETTDAWTVALSLGMLLLAIIGFVTASQQAPGWMQSTVLGVSSTVLSIGLISLGYEIKLRKTIGRELLRLVGIERSLADHHVRNASATTSINWDNVLQGASHFRVLLPDPAAWVDANWARLAAGGRERAIDVEFYFPNPDGSAFQNIAQHLGLTKEELQQNVNRAKNVIESNWKLSVTNSTLVPKSKLRVCYFDGFPSYSLIKADRKVLLGVYASTGKRPADVGFTVGFEGAQYDFPLKWFGEEIARLSSSPSVYENEVGGAK